MDTKPSLHIITSAELAERRKRAADTLYSDQQPLLRAAQEHIQYKDHRIEFLEQRNNYLRMELRLSKEHIKDMQRSFRTLVLLIVGGTALVTALILFMTS